MGPLSWSILLLIVSLMIVALELFVPSGGVLGFLAATSCIGAIVVAFQGGPVLGVSILLAAAMLIPLSLAAAVHIWPHTPFGRLVIQKAPTQDDVLPERRDLRTLIGHRGGADTKMLPGGIVRIADEMFDATTRGEAIERGEPIEVVDVNTNRLVVRKAPTLTDAKVEGVSVKEASVEDTEGDLLSESLENLKLDSLDDSGA